MSGVPGHPQIPGVFEASLGCVRPCPSLTDKVTPLSGAGVGWGRLSEAAACESGVEETDRKKVEQLVGELDGVLGVAHWEQDLTHKHKDLSLGPQHPRKSWTWPLAPGGDRRRHIPGTCWPASLAKLQVQRGTLSQVDKVGSRRGGHPTFFCDLTHREQNLQACGLERPRGKEPWPCL